MESEVQPRDELLRLTERIEALRKDPADAGGLWQTLVAPVCRLFGYRPRFTTEKIRLLVDEVRNSRATGEPLTLAALARSLDEPTSTLKDHFAEALSELSRNVETAELGAKMDGGLAPSYRLWLRNMSTVLLRICPLLEDSKDGWERRVAEAVSMHHMAPPLAGPNAEGDSNLEGGIGGGRLACIDVLLESARAENQSLERRRRLLEAARETLIAANASLVLDEEAVKLRQEVVANQLLEMGRLEASGISPRVAISHQLREAHTRGEWLRLHAGLVGLEQLSLDSADTRAGNVAHQAISAIWQGQNRFDPALAHESSLKSVDEIFGAVTRKRLEGGLQKADEVYRGPNASEEVGRLDPRTLDFVRRHLENLDTSVYLNGLLAVDGCFDVGGILTPTRVIEEMRRTTVVRHPTGELALVLAQGPEDIPDSLIGDPRAIVADLAAGRLLARRFVSEESVKRNRTVLLGELRIYLLDGSTSMLTPRSVLRDAILIAELCTVIARLSDARRSVNPTLYFQYFDEVVREATEVTTAEQAADAIATLLATVRTGGTDIQAAILRSIEQIRTAQEKGTPLARANIVLVTDGEAPINEDEIVARLDSLGDLRTGISIIALGVENPSLRNLAAHQKSAGRRVFYQYMDDATILSIVVGKRDGVCLHPPTGVELADCAELLQQTLDQIEAIARDDAMNTESDAFLEQALGEMDEDTALRAALRGRIEAKNRDAAALMRRFKHWFPELPPTDSAVVYVPDQQTEARLGQVVAIVDAVTEICDVMSADSMATQADALEIFQRSLYDAGITPLEYTQLRDRFPGRFRDATSRLYQAVGVKPSSSGANPSQGHARGP